MILTLHELVKSILSLYDDLFFIVKGSFLYGGETGKLTIYRTMAKKTKGNVINWILIALKIDFYEIKSVYPMNKKKIIDKSGAVPSQTHICWFKCYYNAEWECRKWYYWEYN